MGKEMQPAAFDEDNVNEQNAEQVRLELAQFFTKPQVPVILVPKANGKPTKRKSYVTRDQSRSEGKRKN